jgi:hypothetical protein
VFDFTNSEGNTDYSPYLTLFGGGFSAASTMMAASQSAKLMQANAAIAGEQAQSTQATGAEQAELYRQHLNATIGRQEAQVGGSNLTMSGSPLRSIENTAYLGAQDIGRIQTNAARKAWGFDVQQEGDLFRAKQDQQAGAFSSLGGLITSGARAYGNWSDPNG